MKFVWVGVIFCSIASMAVADQPVKIDRVTHSVWSYEYTTPANATITGECSWKDDKGTYTGGGVTNGTFTDIVSMKRADDSVDVKGKWAVGKAAGTFEFLVASDKKSFDGTYKVDGSDTARSWKGKQTYGFEQYSTTTTASYYCCKCHF